ncbi:MAG: DUF2066 domain-containing protein [Endozoicomonadaceae bacterium]|nr:DUF2066 domain-containing protein [Endozoicomonadaceae bacterium]
MLIFYWPILWEQVWAHDALFYVTESTPIHQKSMRNIAFEKAMRVVLKRLSHDDQLFEFENIQHALKHPSQYVLSYTEKTTETKSRYFGIQFDRRALMNLAKKNNYSLWIAPHPPVFLLLQLQTNIHDIPEILSNPKTETYQDFKDAFSSLFLPIYLPLMDLHDTILLQPTILNNRTEQFIRKAALRYQLDTILFINAKKDVILDEIYHGYIYFFFQDKKYTLSFNFLTINRIAQLSAQFIKTILIEYKKPKINNKLMRSVLIQIEGIRSLRDWAKIEHLLFQPADPDQITWISIESTRVILKLKSQDTLQKISTSLLHKTSDLLFDSEKQPNREDRLIFQWAPSQGLDDHRKMTQ